MKRFKKFILPAVAIITSMTSCQTTPVTDGDYNNYPAYKGDDLEMTVGENGNYTLSLRSEYQFNWESDPIEVTYEANGDYYSATIADLKTLVESTDIQLTKVVTTP